VPGDAQQSRRHAAFERVLGLVALIALTLWTEHAANADQRRNTR
jgi:hypothetical protein